MIYFGQELGERAMDEEGFSGRDGRTTIFDYWTVNSIYRWRNGGTFDGRQLTPQEVELQSFYSTLLNLCSKEKAIREGDFYDLMYANPKSDSFNPRTNYAYLRRAGEEVLLCVTNFDSEDAVLDVNIPGHVFELYQLRNQQKVTATDLLSGTKQAIRFCADQPSQVKVPANSGVILKIK